MGYKGSCHCGKITFEVEGKIDQVIDCNCSHCSRKGFLLWFVPREQLRLAIPEETIPTYLFNKKAIQHKFCDVCGCAPFGVGVTPKTGQKTAAVNVRCLEGVDLKSLKVVSVDGRSF